MKRESMPDVPLADAAEAEAEAEADEDEAAAPE
jgi:hypothetical protein